MNMDSIINICGWTTFAIIAALASLFALAFAWGFIYLGFHLSTRIIRERKAWKQAIKRGNLEMIRMAAFVMRDRLKYGGEATLNDIIKDTYNRQASRTNE